jgi:glycosyltransferase involved in cell wall biosynthesis
VDDLIKAIAIVRRRIPDIKLKVVGAGQEMRNLKVLVDSLGLSRSVEFLGVLDDYEDVVRALKGSSLFVLPSTREGFGMVLVEAYACGIPCIAYVSDGVVEVIENGYNGYLVNQRDIQGLAKRIVQLLRDKKKARAFAQRGRRKVEERFSWDMAADRMEEVYNRLIAEK